VSRLSRGPQRRSGRDVLPSREVDGDELHAPLAAVTQRHGGEVQRDHILLQETLKVRDRGDAAACELDEEIAGAQPGSIGR
jgi:hypothetical protein